MKEVVVFAAGSAIYPIIEIAWRGYTHYSMAIAGGISLCLIDKLCCKRMKSRNIAEKCTVGSAIITSVEFFTGVIVNKLFSMRVWDYSALPLNVLGQICLPFSILWFFLSLPAVLLCEKIDYYINEGEIKNHVL